MLKRCEVPPQLAADWWFKLADIRRLVLDDEFRKSRRSSFPVACAKCPSSQPAAHDQRVDLATAISTSSHRPMPTLRPSRFSQAARPLRVARGDREVPPLPM